MKFKLRTLTTADAECAYRAANNKNISNYMSDSVPGGIEKW
ncbi:MAG TPA: hypothetical protein PLP11_03605 [Bacteroidales bacterium]|nr:hypothetical protein [Bacteroidales bacterium]HQP03670.1 hypothetical protein [Bacteroidales bacterium]